MPTATLLINCNLGIVSDTNAQKNPFLAGMNVIPLTTVQHEGGVAAFWVVPKCTVCEQPFGHELALAVSYPHMALLHEKCLNFYNMHQPWQHKHNLQSYIHKLPEFNFLRQ